MAQIKIEDKLPQMAGVTQISIMLALGRKKALPETLIKEKTW